MQQAVQSFNSNHMVFEHDAAPHMETMTLDNGMLAVKYDTTLDKAFEEICRDLRTQARDVVIGDTEAQIQASWGQIHNSIMKTMSQEQTHGHELTQNLDGQDFSRADWT
jgi:23S rRNA U2552 (ribose-2'-O)-methylase RlmE/FtsJ